jgi:hypothetical protein
MAEPDWNPDTGGRSLAEILREAGIESANRAARRRTWDDPEETGIRQRRAEAAAADGVAGRTGFGRRRSDQSDAALDAPPPAVERRQHPDRRRPRTAVPDPSSTAAIPGLRPDRKPGVPAAGPMLSAPVPVRERRAAEPTPQRAQQRAQQQAPTTAGSRPARDPDHPSTGPIPVVRPGQPDPDDLDATPRESALAWLRFAGELVIALAAGVGVYFAATVLWEIVPHVAVLLAPLAVTGLVTGVGVWRQRQGREPIGARLLAILVFAGTLLTIAPAAGLLAAGS